MTALTSYKYICTKSTAPLRVPVYAVTDADHRRQVHNAFAAIANGFYRVGQITEMPVPVAISNHVLCDGSLLNIADFQELYKLLGTAYGGDGVITFAVPNALAGVSNATAAPPQTVTDGGSVVIGTPTPSPTPTGGQTGGSGTNVSSGGRPRNPNEAIP